MIAVIPALRRRSAASGRTVVALALTLFGVFMLRNVGAMLRFAGAALSYPYDLDYGEGIVWQQARDIVAGHGYAPLGVFPAIVFHYPPVYHLASMALAHAAGLDELVAGRTLSIASTLVTMLLCGLFAAMLLPPGARRDVRIGVGIAAPLIFISFAPVIDWFFFMRVDMLAGALGLGGLWLSVLALRTPLAVAPAALLFVLAIYTKQTSIAGPAAAFVMLLALRPHLAAGLMLACLALGLAALLHLTLVTEGGFLRHILGFNLNRIVPSNARYLVDFTRTYAPFLLAAAAGVTAGVRPIRRAIRGETWQAWRAGHADDVHAGAVLAVLLFFAFKTAMVPMILKSGSSTNYLIEWLSAVAILAAAGIAPLVAVALGANRPTAPMVAGALLLPLQVAQPIGWDLTQALADRQRARLAPLVARIRAADAPVISDEMSLLIRAGKPVLWEPAITAELAASGRYDEAAFARLIRAHRFAFFVTKGERQVAVFDSRYGPLLADAMDAAYPRKENVGGLIVHLPAGADRRHPAGGTGRGTSPKGRV